MERPVNHGAPHILRAKLLVLELAMAMFITWPLIRRESFRTTVRTFAASHLVASGDACFTRPPNDKSAFDSITLLSGVLRLFTTLILIRIYHRLGYPLARIMIGDTTDLAQMRAGFFRRALQYGRLAIIAMIAWAIGTILQCDDVDDWNNAWGVALEMVNAVGGYGLGVAHSQWTFTA